MKKKKIIILSIALVMIIVMALFIGTGFTKLTNVFLNDYSVSEDGTTLTMNVGIASSMGYIRDYNVKLGGTNKYITFYPCFGGFNSNIGAKNEFEIETPVECDEIYFYHGDGGYTLVLQRNDVTGEWEKAK